MPHPARNLQPRARGEGGGEGGGEEGEEEEEEEEEKEKEKEKEKGEVMVMVVVVIVVVAVKEEGKKGTTTAQRVKTRFRTAADSSAKGYLDSWDALDRLHQCGALNDDGQHGTVSQPPCNAVPRTLLLAQYAANMQHP
jgi:hypothetical protein